jgi:hypothetical protein
MHRLIFWKSLMVAPLIGLLVTACNQSTAPSTPHPTVSRQKFPDPTPITPDLMLQHVGYTEADVPYPITAKIRNPNDCDTTTWEVNAPDTLPEGTLGCDLSVVFKASSTETHEVRVSTVNYLGQVVTETAKVFVPRPGSTLSDYPIISSASLNIQEIAQVSGLPAICLRSTVSNWTVINLIESGCGINKLRYSASAIVENPTGKVLTYGWTLYVTNKTNPIERILYSSSEPRFELTDYGYGSALTVTDDCKIALTVNASDSLRGKSMTVWQGKCTHTPLQLH